MSEEQRTPAEIAGAAPTAPAVTQIDLNVDAPETAEPAEKPAAKKPAAKKAAADEVED